MKRKSDIPGVLFFLTLFIVSLVLAFSYGRKQRLASWQVLYVDGAGYYCYLPALFFAGLDPDKMPQDCAEKTGNGFRINNDQKTIQTKYFYGVSFMLSPFFLATHCIAKVFHIPEEGGFALVFEYMIQIAAAIYLILGLLLLEKVLTAWFERKIRYLVIFILFAGTNLFYNSLMAPSMSHVYSFFVFSVFLYSLQRFPESFRWKWFLLISFTIALSVVIRPTSGIIMILLCFWNIQSLKEFLARLRTFLKPVYLLTITGCFAVLALPQLLYWKYAFGSYLFFSYTNEGFTNWNHPFLFEVWLAPKNGLIFNAPVVLFMIAGLVLMIKNKIQNGWVLIFLFLFVSYLTASWWSWEMGCGFGHRAFVEYYAFLCIPLGFFFTRIFQSRFWIYKGIIGMLFLFFCYANFMSSWRYPGCFYGETWDFSVALYNLSKAGVYPGKVTVVRTIPPFEPTVQGLYPFNDSVFQQGPGDAEVSEIYEFTGKTSKAMKDFKGGYPAVVRVNCKIMIPGGTLPGAKIVCSVERNGQSVVWQSFEMDPLIKEQDKWNQIVAKFDIPKGSWSDAYIKVYCWNQKHASFSLRHMIVKFCSN